LFVFGCHRSLTSDYTLNSIDDSYVKGVWGEDWIPFGETIDSKYYYHKKSIHYPSQGVARVWVNIIKKKAVIQGLYYFQGLKHIDCLNKRYLTLTETGYSKEGSVVVPNIIKDPAWLYITPDSPMEALLEVVCP
jgi:hypothetical protein